MVSLNPAPCFLNPGESYYGEAFGKSAVKDGKLYAV